MYLGEGETRRNARGEARRREMAELFVEEGGGGKRGFLCVVGRLGMKRNEKANQSGERGEECRQRLLREQNLVLGTAAPDRKDGSEALQEKQLVEKEGLIVALQVCLGDLLHGRELGVLHVDGKREAVVPVELIHLVHVVVVHQAAHVLQQMEDCSEEGKQDALARIIAGNRVHIEMRQLARQLSENAFVNEQVVH